jgi:LPXTG-site transpeptidase (sortase) family protein
MVNDRQNEKRGPVVPRVPLRWLERGLFILGLLMMGLWFRNETEARASHSAGTRQLEAARLGGGVADAPAPGVSKEPWFPEKLARGVFARIEIPRLGISALITEGAEPSKLERAVGHISTTVFPGQPGNCALAGHHDSFLRGLENVRKSDVIRIDTLQDTYTYVVEWRGTVRRHRVDEIETTEAPSLTLVTGDPFHAAGPAAKRFVVRAKLVVPTALAAR